MKIIIIMIVMIMHALMQVKEGLMLNNIQNHNPDPAAHSSHLTETGAMNGGLAVQGLQ